MEKMLSRKAINKKRKAERAQSNVPEVKFDPDARKEFLTGFHKRKLERRQEAMKNIKEKQRLEKIEERKKIRAERDEYRNELISRAEKRNEQGSKRKRKVDSDDEEVAPLKMEEEEEPEEIAPTAGSRHAILGETVETKTYEGAEDGTQVTAVVSEFLFDENGLFAERQEEVKKALRSHEMAEEKKKKKQKREEKEERDPSWKKPRSERFAKKSFRDKMESKAKNKLKKKNLSLGLSCTILDQDSQCLKMIDEQSVCRVMPKKA
ncbi:putative protein required for cell viability Rrp17 [Planoprotostelium fungivorum]|uniref:Nucleolar protein 12 n=1 Tax=Planoprotostelium fungivorum TaxID=1890364 RepID=A0A2P6NES4_9EUKA|nr:putative protein required for cell viability Rrp17 [Planoprotostelium fungivorum]PRP82464.1 putative protein required for cell viability Rrp17 [Planoprotostelium fungivorum]